LQFTQFAGIKPNRQERWRRFSEMEIAGFASLVRLPLTPHARKLNSGLPSGFGEAAQRQSRGAISEQPPSSRQMAGADSFLRKFCKGFNFNSVHRLTELDASVSLVDD
jgi:hypothetical protein